MQTKDGKESALTGTTSEDSSTKPQMTKQLLQELRSLLRDVNRLMVSTAIRSVPTPDYVDRRFKRRIMKAQVKHTNKMLKNLPVSERLLLLDELRSANASDESKLILPAGAKSSKVLTPR